MATRNEILLLPPRNDSNKWFNSKVIYQFMHINEDIHPKLLATTNKVDDNIRNENVKEITNPHQQHQQIDNLYVSSKLCSCLVSRFPQENTAISI